MTSSRAIDLARARARKWKANRGAEAPPIERWNRAIDEIVPDEKIDERRERLTVVYWGLFDEAPPFNRDAPRPSQ